MKKLRETRGITLVALVITIIILLILAAISIQALTSQGLFGRANDAKRESEIASIKEQIALDIYEKQLEPPVGSITDEQLETILGKYGTVNKEDGTIVGITTEKGYEILLKDIYGGETVAESVPDGAVITPINDITTWLKTGEISKQYSYTTIEQVIADSTCTESLMKNENAMKYLARSTEFADSICASETAMTYLGQSEYVDDTVLNSDIWIEKIPMSPYWNKVSNIAVTLHGGVLETITITGLYGSPTVTTNSDGNVNYQLPIGTFTFTGAISGQSFAKTVNKGTSDVYVMPDGIVLYWYGYKGTDIYSYYWNNDGGDITQHTNYITIKSRAYIRNKQPIDLSQYSRAHLSGKSSVYMSGRYAGGIELCVDAPSAWESYESRNSQLSESSAITSTELDIESGEQYIMALVNLGALIDVYELYAY